MEISNLFSISAAGMDIERLRADVASLNMANSHAAWPVSGTGYQPLRVVSSNSGFDTQLKRWATPPGASIEISNAEPREVMEVGNPLANEHGFVRYPAVNQMTEMFTMMTALRAYEANVVAFNISRTMAIKALDIGGQT